MTRQDPFTAEELLAPYQVAQAFNVDVKSVTRWARTGKLNSIRTPGGHRRYKRAEIEALLAQNSDGPR